MYPALQINDRLLVAKFYYGARIPFTDLRVIPLINPKTGDLVVFKFPKDRDRDYIKRCIGTPGDVVEVKNKDVFLNGKELKEEYAKHVLAEMLPKVGGVDSRDNFGPFTVPADSYFMMGDNRDESNDSRFWGVVPAKDIVGRAAVIYWPLNRVRVIW